MSEEIIFYAVGDVGPNRDDPDSIFKYVADVIKSGDLAFCQLESVLSRRGVPLPQVRLVCSSDPSVAGALKKAGFQVVSFASNHCMDLGREAFQDTIDALQEQGLDVIGVGNNIEEARTPAIKEIKGTRIAFLAYNSILPQSFWADEDRPGCAPLRVHTVYEPIEHDQPGTPCRTHTFARRDDLKAMLKDISQAKEQSDLVFVSLHWGIHFVPAVLADYQQEVAYAAIEAGADLILGHHAHILKGVEVYKGKAIFYSLGNYAIELPPHFKSEVTKDRKFKEIQVLNKDWDPEKAPWPKDSYKSVTVKCVIKEKKIDRVSVLPTYIDMDNHPQIVQPQDERFHEIYEYLTFISREQGLTVRMEIEGDEIVIQGEE